MTMIHGILSLSRHEKIDGEIATMAGAAKAFVPDGTKIWQADNIALAANLLFTLPEGRQEKVPVLTDQAAGLTMVASARIDNREELLGALGVEEARHPRVSDNRLILAAYQKWGEQAPAKLLGDFAFAIWDSRQQILFCARDPFNQHPFYYYFSPTDGLFFSSDLSVLRLLERIPKRLDEGYIADIIARLGLYVNKTPYQDIHALEAAHWLKIQNGRLQTKVYWQPDLSRELRYKREETYVEHYLDLLTEAVNCRLATTAPIASLVSGGLDSSSISMLAARMLYAQGKSLSSFCHVLPAEESMPETDERGLVTLLTRQGGLNVSWVSRDNFDLTPCPTLPGDADFVGHPFLLTSMNRMKQQGCRVFLEGFGGDQLATSHGHDLVYWQLRHWKLSGFYRQVRAAAKQRNSMMLRTSLSLIRRHRKHCPQAISATEIQRFLTETCLFSQDFAKRFDLVGMALKSHRFRGGHPTSFRTSMWNRLKEGINASNQGPATFSRMGLERRRPMFDQRLVAFCLALPPEQHRLGDWGRRLVRRAMQGILPDEIRLRHNKWHNANPGIHKEGIAMMGHYRHILERAMATKEIGGYIDLQRLGQRLDEWPDYIATGQEREFKLMPTLRAIHLAQFMLYHYHSD